MLDRIKYYDGSIQSIKDVPAHVKEKYRETFEIDMRWLVRAAAARGKWIDQSQSLNIFFSGTSGKELSDLYLYAWEMGLKTTYYLRTLGASQVEKSTIDAQGTQMRAKRDEEAHGAPMPVLSPMATPSPLSKEVVEAARVPVSQLRARSDTSEAQADAPAEQSVVPDAQARSAGTEPYLGGTVTKKYTLHVAEDAICEACQ
jgi:ribonucleoside-diphosphate reductase alpha chain